jgi:hypothetical protein
MMTSLYAFSICILLTFVARFICLNGLVCFACDKVGGGINVVFYVMEGYWVEVTANHSSKQQKNQNTTT